MPGGELQLGSLRPAGLLPQRIGVVGQLSHVKTRLEDGTVAGIDDDPDVRIGVKLGPGSLEFGEHDGVDGVAGPGPIEDQPPDRPPVLYGQRLIVVHFIGSRAVRW